MHKKARELGSMRGNTACSLSSERLVDHKQTHLVREDWCIYTNGLPQYLVECCIVSHITPLSPLKRGATVIPVLQELRVKLRI